MRRGSILGVGAVAIVLVAAAGCGGDDEGDGESAATESGSGDPGAGGSSSSGNGGDSSGSGNATSSSGEGASTGAGAAPGCPSTHTCAEPPPPNWTGPVALSLGDSQPACVGSYPNDAGAYFTDLDPGAAACQCECNPATGIQCDGGASLCYSSGIKACTAAFCAIAGPSATLPSNACTSIPVPADPDKVSVSAAAPTNPGSCTPSEAHDIPAPTWGTQAKACGGAEVVPDACGEGLCMPAAVAPFDKLCIARTGEVACPSAFYSEQHVVYESFTDTRSCSACSCGSASSSCGGSVTFTYSFGSPCNVAINDVPVGGCGDLDPQTQQGSYYPQPTGSCPPSDSALSGEVTANAPVTYCCHPE